MEIKISNDTIDESIIGELISEKKNKNVKDLLHQGKKEIINLGFYPWDIIVFPKNRILCSNYGNKNLTLHDEAGNLIRLLDKINGSLFQPCGIAFDEEENNLFITDLLMHQIIMTDIEFNKIKTVGSAGEENNQFNSPVGICFKNGNLYVCDHGNKRIKMFSKDLEFIKSLNVDYGPSLIKATDSLICVQSFSSPNFFYMYQLGDLVLHRTIDSTNLCFKISVINSLFYRCNFKRKTILCYNEDGNLDEEIILSNLDDNIISGQNDGMIVELNGKLYMTSNSKGKLVIITQN